MGFKNDIKCASPSRAQCPPVLPDFPFLPIQVLIVFVETQQNRHIQRASLYLTTNPIEALSLFSKSKASYSHMITGGPDYRAGAYAATIEAQAGLIDSLIQTLGRWHSAALNNNTSNSHSNSSG